MRERLGDGHKRPGTKLPFGDNPGGLRAEVANLTAVGGSGEMTTCDGGGGIPGSSGGDSNGASGTTKLTALDSGSGKVNSGAGNGATGLAARVGGKEDDEGLLATNCPAAPGSGGVALHVSAPRARPAIPLAPNGPLSTVDGASGLQLLCDS